LASARAANSTSANAPALPTVQDADDLYYDSARKRVYVCGGEGYISVFQQEDAGGFEPRRPRQFFET
jgi:hypothetical protein